MDDVNPYEPAPPVAMHLQPPVDSAQLVEMAAALDTWAGDCPPAGQLTQFDQHSGALIWIANRAALLRLAAALLRLASKDPERDAPATLRETPPLLQMVTDSNDRTVTEIRHAIEVPEPLRARHARTTKRWLWDRVGLVGCAIVGFIVLGLILSGCAFWFGIVTGTIE